VKSHHFQPVDIRETPVDNGAPMKAPRFLLRGFLRPREVALVSLGKLERQLMDELWARGETTVRSVYLAFEERIAYTTLMTTLDRLYKKGLLRRRKHGRAFLYATTVTPEQLEQGIREDVIYDLVGTTGEAVEPLLACIVDAVGERDRELLDELDRLIKEKRRELRRKD
jgi:predicted transcriptional regulator